MRKFSLGLETIGSEIYQENKDSTATHNKKLYNLNILFKLAHDRTPIQILIDELVWVLPYTTTFKKRVDDADLTKPILVFKDPKYGLTVIDGAHRLTKAHGLGNKYMLAIMLTDKHMQKALIN